MDFKKTVTSLIDLEGDTIDAIKWVAAEYKYLTKLKEDLEKIGKDASIDDEKKDYKKAWRALRYIGRSQRKAEREVKEVEEELKSVVKDYPQLIDVEKEIEIEEKELLKAFSLYSGSFKEELSELLLAIKKQEKLPQGAVKKKVDEIEQHVDVLIKWVGALQASLKKESMTIAQLKKLKEKLQKAQQEEIKRNHYRQGTYKKLIKARMSGWMRDKMERVEKELTLTNDPDVLINKGDVYAKQIVIGEKMIQDYVPFIALEFYAKALETGGDQERIRKAVVLRANRLKAKLKKLQEKVKAAQKAAKAKGERFSFPHNAVYMWAFTLKAIDKLMADVEKTRKHGKLKPLKTIFRYGGLHADSEDNLKKNIA
ncbi:hypothetical protein GF361_04500 [Candidatus Woesearchaeota archaeon]|nr:hypothetical protein [Candidatus Woesearchaeota archaeon]